MRIISVTSVCDRLCHIAVCCTRCCLSHVSDSVVAVDITHVMSVTSVCRRAAVAVTACLARLLRVEKVTPSGLKCSDSWVRVKQRRASACFFFNFKLLAFSTLNPLSPEQIFANALNAADEAS